MKTMTLLTALVWLTGATAIASNQSSLTLSNNRYDEPISFTERGITFYVFTDGGFDFSTTPATSSEVVYRNGRRHTEPQGIRITRDAQGRIRSIGSVFMNYDAQDRIKRIGSVFMNYNRFALAQVGGLKIVYNHNGDIIKMFGSVKGRENWYNSCEDDNDNHFHTNSHHAGLFYRNSKNDK